jgi:hypothetical protein
MGGESKNNCNCKNNCCKSNYNRNYKCGGLSTALRFGRDDEVVGAVITAIAKITATTKNNYKSKGNSNRRSFDSASPSLRMTLLLRRMTLLFC